MKTAQVSRTQEPWTEPRCYSGLTRGNVDRIAVYGNEGRTLVAAIRPLSSGHAKEARANFALIGAAPDLLDACKKLLAAAKCNYDPQAALSEYGAIAEAAIAKAEGRT